MLCILWNVKYVVYSMWVALARRLGLGLITTRRAIVSLSGALRVYLRLIFFRHFAGKDHHGFLEDIKVIIIDRLNGNGRIRESFWQYKLETFAPRGLNIRLVET